MQSMVNVDIYRSSPLTAPEILEFGCDHVVIATGAKWSREILAIDTYPEGEIEGDNVYTPDDILSGAHPEGPVVIYDFDHYYMGGCLAEVLRKQGVDVTIVTPAAGVSAWTFMNNESEEIRQRMTDLGVKTVFEYHVTDFEDGTLKLSSIYPRGDARSIECRSLVIVGNRTANDGLYHELKSDQERLAEAGISTVTSIGDCRAPGTIAHAVYSGHECARNIDIGGAIGPFLLEKPQIFAEK